MPLRFHPVFYSLLSALLLTISWQQGLSFCIFLAFVPLLTLETHFRARGARRKAFLHAWLAFLLWNIGVTWWVVYASFGGALMAFVCNSLLMAVVFLLYSMARGHFPSIRGAWLILPIWLTWEHLHTLWDLSWTWLTLGNVFASHPYWIQWYELTGTSGGTLWVLSANIVAFSAVTKYQRISFLSKPVLRLALLILLPIALSYFIYLMRLGKEMPQDARVKVTVVQPNIDPYNEKFYFDYQTQFLKMLNLVRDSLDAETDYLVLPETFITGSAAGLNENEINFTEEIRWFRDSLLKKFPGLRIVAGGNTYITYDHAATATARYDRHGKIWYDVFNTGLLIDTSSVAVYHKSKLVPGVEKMPFPALFKPLESLAIDMGGTIGSLGIQDSRDVFHDTLRHTGVAPVICYESVFADYVTEYVRNGANLIFIITNDGWWDDTPGYHQHLLYGRLRAIENRREIARSANTGISCFIDRFGNIRQTTPWWKEAVISSWIYKNDYLTFFSKYGDLISYMSVVFSLLLFMWIVLRTWPGRLLKAGRLAAGKKP